MSGPIRDVKRLADLVYDSWRQRGMIPGVDWFAEAAEAVRDACVPPGTHVVVPKAGLAALLDAAEGVVDEDDWEGAFNGQLNAAINRLYEAAQLVRAALERTANA